MKLNNEDTILKVMEQQLAHYEATAKEAPLSVQDYKAYLETIKTYIAWSNHIDAKIDDKIMDMSPDELMKLIKKK